MPLITELKLFSAPHPKDSANGSSRQTALRNVDWSGFSQCINEPANPGRGCLMVCSVTDRRISIVLYEDGSVKISMDRPPVDDVIMSGGGAKGVAYSGLVETLTANNVMDLIRRFSGSSAGAISAALLASGMSHADFDRISDYVSLVSLLNSTQPDLAAEQDEWSRMGKNMNAIPLVQLLCDLLPRLGSKGMPLEELIRKESHASLLQHCARGPLSEQAQKAVDNVRSNQYVTFADLATLSQEIPQIKSLEITGTAMLEGGAQLVVFSADLTPDMDIAVAAHISAALPVVFSKPTLQGQPFQPADATTAFADGGILNNTPIPALYNPMPQMSPIPEGEPLILVFEAEESNQQKPRGTGISALVDRFLKAPHTALSALNAERMKPFADQTIVVPLKTDKGDYRGLLNGTVHFSMSTEVKNHLQEELRKAVSHHLQTRNAVQQTFWFASFEAALLALGDKAFEQLGAELKGNEAYDEVAAFRQQAQQTLANLKRAIQKANMASSRLEPTPQIREAIGALDQLADKAGKLEWLAKRINHRNDPDFMQLLQAAVRWDSGATTGVSEVTRQAIEEMDRRDLATRIDNVVRDVLQISSFLGGQTTSNRKLLEGSIRDLRDAQTPEAFNNALERVIANYTSRYTGMKPLSSKTVEQLRNWRIKPPIRGLQALQTATSYLSQAPLRFGSAHGSTGQK
ncbi:MULTISPECIES: patatin-like phospholipase family protein [unclassified Pseudomonas]|uniref:patatin-like phospholipase family protein n=1 Tax=unclassified Pseudomonas TaxID=196821 RepID=UPI0039B73259